MKKDIKKLIFLGLLFSTCVRISSAMPLKTEYKGIPIIQKFYFPNNCLSKGRFSIYEDSSGVFLIGANNKVIIFYGNEFTTYPLSGTINVTSNTRSVFFTGFDILGLVKTYRNSPPQFIPLIDDRDSNKFSFGQINDLYIADQNLLFSNGKRLYQYDGSGFNVIDSSKVQLQIFRVSDSLLISIWEKGVGVFKEGSVKFLKNGEKFARSKVETIIPFGSNLIVKRAESNSFFLLGPDTYKKIDFGFEEFLDRADFTDAVNIDGNKIAIGTKKEGLLIYDCKENTIRNITVKEGLLANTVNNLHVDRNGNLWAFHDIGLSRIEINTPITAFGEYAGITGRINDIIKFDNKLYLATTTGLLVSSFKNIANTSGFTQLSFNQVSNAGSECLKFLRLKDDLFLVSSDGIKKIIGEKSQTVLNLGISCFRNVVGSDSVFYIGNSSGLHTLKQKNGKFFLNDLNLYYSITDLSVDTDQNLWIKTESGNLIYFNTSKQKTIFSFLGKFPGINTTGEVSLLQTKEGTRIITSDQIYNFNKNTGLFFSDTTLRIGKLKGISWIYPIITDIHGNRWCHFMSNIDNVRGIIMFPSGGGFPKFFNTGSLISPVISDGDQIWLGGYANLIRFSSNQNFKNQNKFFTIIKRIVVGKDSILKPSLVEPEISHSLNTVRFDVSFTNFESHPFVRYQYKLENYDKQWSDWTNSSFKQYSNLKAGNYIFKVRALSITGVVSDVTEFGFYIQHPIFFTWPAYIIYFIVFCFLVLVFFRWRMWVFLKNKEKLEKIVQSRTMEILKEKDKSEQLLANVFPKYMTDELKSTGKAASQKFSLVTVLFSDIQGFTKIAEQMNPENLIDQLDTFFFHFDMVVEKYNIEKIKTIGDAYMCAGGIPKKNITNPVEVVLAALEVQEYMKELKAKNADIWDLRIGIHTGSVIAGVVGHKKLSYDIWGDTVNTASRMESSGEPGKINISGHTYELVKDFFICEHRGRMPVKYKGEIDMYFVKGIRPELSVNMKNLPNKKFLLQLQLLRLQDIEEEVMENFTQNLPVTMYFHSVKNAKDVYGIVELLGRAEELNDEEILLVQTAALLHDTGYIWRYDNHVDESINYARKILPEYKYSESQIDHVCNLMESTKNNHKPANILEEILYDATMHYLGRADYLTLSENLFRELHENGKINSKDEWVRMQIDLLQNFSYYTKTAKMLCDVNAEQQIQNITEKSKINEY